MVEALGFKEKQQAFVPSRTFALSHYTPANFFSILNDRTIENKLRTLGLVRQGDTITVARKFGASGLTSQTVTIKNALGIIKAKGTIENGKVTLVMIA